MSKELALLHGELTIPFSPILADLFEITGALLIQQIHYWCETKPNLVEGHRWHYNTYEEWARQIRVRSEVTVRRKLKELVALGVVVTGVFNKFGYDRTLWYRVDYDKLALLLGSATMSMWSKRSHGSGTFDHIQLIKTIGPIPKNTQEKTKEHLSQHSLADQDPPLGDQESQEKDMKAEEILKKKEGEKKEKVKAFPGQKVGVHALAMLWKKRLGGTPKMLKDLTNTETVMFKHPARTLGGQSLEVLDYALDNWTKFCERVALKKGIGKPPMDPQVPFFCKHYEVAAQLIAENQPKPVANTPTEPLLVTNSSSSPTEKSGSVTHTAHVPATMEDMQETLASLDAIYKAKAKQ